LFQQKYARDLKDKRKILGEEMLHNKSQCENTIIVDGCTVTLRFSQIANKSALTQIKQILFCEGSLCKEKPEICNNSENMV